MENSPPPFDMLANRRTIQWLLVPCMLLPVGMVFLFAFGRLFGMLGDPISALVLDGIALGFGLIWLLGLVTLLFSLAMAFLQRDR